MIRKIRISAKTVSAQANLNENSAADNLWEALPLQGKANLWGDEIYFEVPLQMGEAGDARTEMEVGELAFWPGGIAFCIFFGPTPASTSSEPRAAGPVTVIGKITDLGDLPLLKRVNNGDMVKLKLI